MRTPRESFEDIARLMAVASDAMESLPHNEASLRVLGCIVQAHTAALVQASSLKKREQAQANFVLMAQPAPTETRQ